MSIPDNNGETTMAARIAKGNVKSKSKTLRRNTKKVNPHHTRDMVIGITAIGMAGYLVGQAIEKAVSYA